MYTSLRPTPQIYRLSHNWSIARCQDPGEVYPAAGLIRVHPGFRFNKALDRETLTNSWSIIGDIYHGMSRRIVPRKPRSCTIDRASNPRNNDDHFQLNDKQHYRSNCQKSFKKQIILRLVMWLSNGQLLHEPKLHAFPPCKTKPYHLSYTSGRDRVGSSAGEHLFLLGPEAYARINLNQEYMITALKPFTNSQLNDLRAFSAELIGHISENFKPQTYHHASPTCIHQTSYYTSGEVNGPDHRDRRMASLQAKGALINLQISYPTIHNTYITSSTDRGPCSHSCTRL
ncbi:uncharacterized protein H6S33_010236 [Morchella sextelata]|uniref:uncharacterized protein n=1 Tax=Morchella sextelata TaxID=1174677 RepID=UPI001D03CFAF|nr:uncharacterized protein H6S33_010236 [Morchella sextelata]KAH0612184.1 hypothetical protein H6S33_010236 [Morchella sextelata]